MVDVETVRKAIREIKFLRASPSDSIDLLRAEQSGLISDSALEGLEMLTAQVEKKARILGVEKECIAMHERQYGHMSGGKYEISLMQFKAGELETQLNINQSNLDGTFDQLATMFPAAFNGYATGHTPSKTA